MSFLKKALRVSGQICLALLSIVLLAAIVRLGLIPSLENIFELNPSTTSVMRRICMIIAFTVGYWIYVRRVDDSFCRNN